MIPIGNLGERIFRIRPDSYFVRKGTGVWLRNNHGSFTVKGPGSYDLIRFLFQGLDGEHTLDEICWDEGEAVRAGCHRLVKELLRNRFLKEFHGLPEAVPEWMSESYPEHLAFLDYWVERPVAVFEGLRATRVACVGDGPLLEALVGALGDLGMARLDIITPDIAAIAPKVQAALQRDPSMDWCVTRVPDEMAVLRSMQEEPARGARYLLLASSAVGLEGLRRLAAEMEMPARHRGQVVAYLTHLGRRVVATPLAAVDDPWCGECVGHAVLPGRALALAPTPVAIAAFHLAQQVFCHLAGPPVPQDRSIVTVDLQIPTVRSHRPQTHPLCEAHAPEAALELPSTTSVDSAVVPDVPDPLDTGRVSEIHDRIVAITSRWTDPVVGPLLAVTEGDHEQLPLSASRCLVRVSAGSRAAHWVTCSALSPRGARNQAVLGALEWLGEHTAAAHGGYEKTLDFGAGWTPAEALFRALVKAAMAVRQVPLAEQWFQHDGSQESSDPTRRFLCDALAHAGPWESSDVQRLDSGLLRVQVRRPGQAAVCGVGVDRRTALNHALMQLLATTEAVVDVFDGEQVTESSVIGLPAPPGSTWEDVIRLVKERAVDRPNVTDVRHLLPFLGRDAVLVGIPRLDVGT